MGNVLFISTVYLKKNTIIESNVEDHILTPNILKAQVIEIQNVIGTSLYDALIVRVIAGTVTGNYKTLMDDYIAPSLSEWSLYYALPAISMRLENSSIVMKDTENSTPVSLDDVKYLRNDIRNTSEFLSDRLSKYLCANASSFPEFRDESESDEVHPSSNNFFSGIYLGDTCKSNIRTYKGPENCC